MTEHKVYFEDRTVGKVTIENRGLYYYFFCDCRLPSDDLYDLTVLCEGKKSNLGLCIPNGRGFGLRTRMPVKHVGTGKMHFSLSPRKPKQSKHIVKVSESEPFEYLDRLSDACFTVQNGQASIVFQASTEMSKPTGQ